MKQHWKAKYKVVYYRYDLPKGRIFKDYENMRDFVDELCDKGKVHLVFEYDKEYESFIRMPDLCNGFEQ